MDKAAQFEWQFDNNDTDALCRILVMIAYIGKNILSSWLADLSSSYCNGFLL